MCKMNADRYGCTWYLMIAKYKAEINNKSINHLNHEGR